MKALHRSASTTMALPRMLAVLAIAILATVSIHRAQGPSTPPSDPHRAYRAAMEIADRKIAAEVKAHTELMKNLEYLTERIGPRMTGSPQMQRASDWSLERFREYGLEAHLETTEVSHAWYRGHDTASIVSPIQREVEIRSAGWTRATNGDLTAPVFFLDRLTAEEIARQKDKIKGAIVCLGKPHVVLPAGQPAANANDAEGMPTPPNKVDPSEPPPLTYADRWRIFKLLSDAGIAAALFDSNKPDRLFNMTRANPCCDPSMFPVAMVPHEDYTLLHRLSQTEPVRLKINLTGTFSPGPQPASITVAEIQGTEHPDERVIIGGHLDSWDLGEGALDDGTGAMATLEAARALKALGWQPKRTLTFILFVGEELSGIGSRLYIKNHAAEIPKVDAVLVHDTGTGRVIDISLQQQWETAPHMYWINEPLRTVFGLEALETRVYDGSDHIAFRRAGVPGFSCVQAPAQYREAHHSQADTFDKVLPEEINQGAAVLASWMWNVSEYPTPLPHHPAVPQEDSLGAPSP